MSATTNTYSTPLSLVFKIIEFKGYEFAVEPFVGPYVLVTLIGSDLPAKQARRTRAAIQSAIIALYEDMTPPTPPAAAVLRIVPQARVYAVSNPRSDNKVNIPTTTQGTVVDCHDSDRELYYWVGHHEKKYGTPNAIRVNPNSELAGIVDVGGIPVTTTKSVLPGFAWIGYDPAKAEGKAVACKGEQKENIVKIKPVKLSSAQREVLELIAGGFVVIYGTTYVVTYDPQADSLVMGGNFGLTTFRALQKRNLITETKAPADMTRGYPGKFTYWRISDAGRAALEGGNS